MICIPRVASFPLLAGLVLGLWLAASPQIQAQNAPDNTKNSQGDADKGATTADQQKMNAADRNITKGNSQFHHERQVSFELRAQHQDHHARRQSHFEGPSSFRGGESQH
jgi:hypothetical protein